MKKFIIVILLLSFSSLSYGCFGQQEVSTELYISKYFSNSYMPDYGGNIDISWRSTFGFSKFGIGNSIGFKGFEPVNYYNVEIRHYTIPIRLILFRLIPLRFIELEINADAGLHFLFGTETQLKDSGPDWSGHYYHKGDVTGIGVWPGGLVGAHATLSKRFKTTNIGLHIGYEYLFKSPGFATDIYNPEAIGGGLNIGIHIGKWFGRYVNRIGH